jgi:hypothetical protein
MKTVNMRLSPALLFMIAIAGFPAQEATAQEGHEQTDRLIKRAEATMKAIGTTKDR